MHVYPLTSRSLQVTWRPPNPEGHNGVIKGYYLGYKPFPSSEPYIFKTITVESLSSDGELSVGSSGTNLIEVKVTDLKRASKYSVIVQAFNAKGPGPQTDEVVGETMINDPPPAPSLSIASVRLTAVELHWSFNESQVLTRRATSSSLSSSVESFMESQASQSSQDSLVSQDLSVSGYYLHFKSPHSSWEERQISGQHSSYTFSDLLCGTYYQFYVIAYNAIGKGDPSQVVAVKTKGGRK